MPQNMKAGIWRKVVIAVHNNLPPEQQEWDNYLEVLVRTLNSDSNGTRVLTITDGGAPNAGQRSQLFQQVRGKYSGTVLGSVVSDSILVRTVVTAFALVNPGSRAFSPRDFDTSLHYLGITSLEEKSQILQYLRSLAEKIPNIRTIHQLAIR